MIDYAVLWFTVSLGTWIENPRVGGSIPPPGTIKNSDKARHCAGFVVSAALLLLRRLKRDRCLFLAEPECVLPHTGKYLLLSSTAPSA
jgi:hypothetical protein